MIEKFTYNMAQYIVHARKQAGMTRQDLADKLGIKYATLGTYETGRAKKIPTETLEKMLEILPPGELGDEGQSFVNFLSNPLTLSDWVEKYDGVGFDALGVDFLDTEIKNLSGLLTERQRRVLLNLALAVFKEDVRHESK